MCLRQLHLPLQTKLDEFQSELFQVDLRLRLAARGRSSSLFFGLVSYSLLPHALSKFFSKQPQFPCFFTQIIPLLTLSSGLKCSSMSFGRSYCHSDSLFLFFVSCSGFEIRYTLKGRVIYLQINSTIPLGLWLPQSHLSGVGRLGVLIPTKKCSTCCVVKLGKQISCAICCKSFSEKNDFDRLLKWRMMWSVPL